MAGPQAGSAPGRAAEGRGRAGVQGYQKTGCTEVSERQRHHKRNSKPSALSLSRGQGRFSENTIGATPLPLFLSLSGLWAGPWGDGVWGLPRGGRVNNMAQIHKCRAPLPGHPHPGLLSRSHDICSHGTSTGGGRWVNGVSASFWRMKDEAAL